jgi:hypothetical protein
LTNKSKAFNHLITPFWLVIWSCTLTVGWLLPNHYRPWAAFHSDAWIAATLLIAAIAVTWRSRGSIQVHIISALVALLIFVPWLQVGFGLISQPGVAWISSAYLLGLLLALLIGVRWESDSPGQLGDGLFFAIGMAAILSVGLQLQQWFQLEGLDLWRLGGGAERPHANLGQANQLGTLLIWGVLAGAWGYFRKYISGKVAVFLAVYLLFGVALTGSRTAWIGVALLVATGWLWRRHLHSPRVPWIVSGLGLYFVVCVLSVGWLNQIWLAKAPLGLDDFTRMSSEIRPLAWVAFLDAAWQRPFFGYGWNQVVLAQMAVATEHPHIPGFFIYSHNLFLDLVLWCGIPMGLLVSGFLVMWLWQRFHAVQSAENAVLVLFLLVVANHAMLELPLHFAYFLLPVGLVMGVLDARMGVRPVFLLGRWTLGVLWLVASMLLCLIIQDYARVESSYQILRLEWSRIKITIPVGPPDVLLLTQWRDYIKFARMEPKRDVGEDELVWMRNITGLFPGVIFFHKFATVLALNQRPEEAQLWLKRMCKTVSESECRDVQTIWANQSLKVPEIAAIAWPVKTAE